MSCGCANTVSKDRAVEKTPQVDMFPIGLRARTYKNNGRNKPPQTGQPSGVRKKSKTGPCQNNAGFMYQKSGKAQSDRVQGRLLKLNFLHLRLLQIFGRFPTSSECMHMHNSHNGRKRKIDTVGNNLHAARIKTALKLSESGTKTSAS